MASGADGVGACSLVHKQRSTFELSSELFD